MSGRIQYIKISRIDNNGTDNTRALESLSTVVLPSGSSFKEYSILNRTKTNDYFLYYVLPPDRKDIANDDKSDLRYSFSGSYTGFHSTFRGFVTSSVDEDNLGFFIPAGGTGSLGSLTNPQFFISCYRIPTLPAKNLGIRVSSSIQFDVDDGKATTTQITASVRILSSPLDIGIVPQNPNVLAQQVLTQSAQNLDTSDMVFTGSYDLSTTMDRGSFNPGDCIYFDFNIDAKGMGGVTPVAVSFTNASFSNGIFEISSSAANNNFKDLIIEPYFTSKFFNEDCDVLQNNATQGIPNELIQKIDYSTSATNPVNIEPIISGTAVKADIPQSLFELGSLINPSFSSKIQSLRYNYYELPVFTTEPGFSFQNQIFNLTYTDFNEPINIGLYGQTAAIDVNQSLVAYCDWIGGTTPELNGKVAAHIKYLINENGDAVSPNLFSTTIRDVQNNFVERDNIEVSLIEPSPGSGMEVLNGDKTIIKGGYRVEPILYTQIPTSPFSSSIEFITSSLLPLQDVRSSAIRDGAQSFNAGTSDPLICASEFFDKVNSYNNTTGIYTVQSSTVESGVDITFETNFTYNVPPTAVGELKIRIENTSTSTSLVEDERDFGGGSGTGVSSSFAVSLRSTVLAADLVAGHQYKVLVDLTNFGGGSVSTDPFANFITSQTPNPNPLPLTGSFWGYSGSRKDVLTGSQDPLNINYNFFTQKQIPDSGFKNNNYAFKILPGDQFRFENDESKVFNVTKVTDPNFNPEGKIIVFLDREISTSINKDYFLIRRYVGDGSFIIFDENKPAGSSGPAFIKPKFTTSEMDKDIDFFIQDLQSKNLLT